MMIQGRRVAGLLSLALGVTLTACGGSGGSSSRGGAALPEHDRAVMAGLAGASMAQVGIGVAGDIEGSEPVQPMSGSGDVTPRVGTLDEPELCTSGSQTLLERTGPSPAELPSPYFAGEFEQTVIDADACRFSFSGGGMSFSSYTDGVFEIGYAENEKVMYFRAADATGDIGGFYHSSMSGSGGMPNMDIKTRGIVHVCEGCSAPEHGSEFEMLAFLRTEQAIENTSMNIIMGDSLAEPLQMRSSGTVGGQGERVLNGRMGFSMRGNPCAFDAIYETISPLIVRNHDLENETIIGGELAITMVGGDTYDVTFGDGIVMVNGSELSEADMQRLQRHCAFDDEL